MRKTTIQELQTLLASINDQFQKLIDDGFESDTAAADATDTEAETTSPADTAEETTSIKAGKRNSRADQDRVQAMHDHAVGLGARCSSESKSALPLLSEKALSLDKLVSAVRDAVWKERDARITAWREAQDLKPGDDGYFDYDSDVCCPECVAVYDGYAVLQEGLTNYKVNYTVGDLGVELQPREQWQPVENAWVAKAVKAWQDQRELGAVKALGGGRLGNYLVVWGDTEQRDLYGEFFTKNTEGLTTIFDYLGKVPALYQHGMDGAVKYTPVGVIDTMVIDEVGLWTETQLDLANKYAQEIQKLARKKALGASSGTFPGARKVSPNGEILQWPIIEGSFTPTPAEPRLRELPVAEVKGIYGELGL